MIATYIFIICLSTGLASWAGLRLWQRVTPLLGDRYQQAGICALIPVIAFLIVVGAPASVLFFAFATLGIGLMVPTMLQTIEWRTGWVGVAVVVPLIFLHPPKAGLFGTVPLQAIYATSFAMWVAVMVSAAAAEKSLQGFGLSVVLACVPLAATPFLLHHASSVATDAAIIVSAWLGVIVAATSRQMTGAATQFAMAFLLGYLQLAAIWQGAWIAGVASMIVWVMAIVVAAMQRVKADNDRFAGSFPHA
jgi:hypothetical protein